MTIYIVIIIYIIWLKFPFALFTYIVHCSVSLGLCEASMINPQLTRGFKYSGFCRSIHLRRYRSREVMLIIRKNCNCWLNTRSVWWVNLRHASKKLRFNLLEIKISWKNLALSYPRNGRSSVRKDPLFLLNSQIYFHKLPTFNFLVLRIRC